MMKEFTAVLIQPMYLYTKNWENKKLRAKQNFFRISWL